MLPNYIKIAHEIAQKAHAGQVDKAGMIISNTLRQLLDL